MSTIYVNKIIKSDFETINDLQNLFYENAFKGVVLGVKFGDKMATVEQKKAYKGVSGWLVSYGKHLKKGFISESKATVPSNFTTSLLCSENYTVETL